MVTTEADEIPEVSGSTELNRTKSGTTVVRRRTLELSCLYREMSRTLKEGTIDSLPTGGCCQTLSENKLRGFPIQLRKRHPHLANNHLMVVEAKHADGRMLVELLDVACT